MAMKLTCMQKSCKERYTIEEIQQFCSTKIQKQYNVIKDDIRVGKSRKLKWCARPGCERTVTRPGCICNRRAICVCGFETCFKCGDPYHEAECQVSGTTGILMHNLDPRATKCPSCRAPVYKQDGCNHMRCYRCNKEWCWICRSIISGYGHFSPKALFGCSGMTHMPQSVILYFLAMTVLLLIVPFALVSQFSSMLGRYCCSRLRPNENSLPGIVFFGGVLLFPMILVPTLFVLPFVLLYRVYIVVSLIFRHFILCCCC